MFDQKVCQVALSQLPGVGNMLARQLISYCGSAQGVFQEKKYKLLKIPGIGPKIASLINNHSHFNKAEVLVKKCNDQGTQILHYTDKSYPDRLRQIFDAPLIIFYKGDADLNSSKTVGIVGTRNASQYGKAIVEEIVKGISKHVPFIISGLAYGIDFHAHTMALKYQLPTIGIIAGGFNNLYPSLHLKTALKMQEKGGLISEYEPDTLPESHHFPDRNRIIAGLCDVLIVVEAAKKGGALITAEYANNYNRDVFAVPGNLGRAYSEGCNNYIKMHKAHIYTSPKDIEYIMNWETGNKTELKPVLDVTVLTPPEKQIMNAFNDSNTEIQIDELSWKSQISISQLASHLLNLEFRGYIKMLPGKKIKCCI